MDHDAAAAAVLEGVQLIGSDAPPVVEFEGSLREQIAVREAERDPSPRPSPEPPRGDATVLLLQRISLQLDQILQIMRGGASDG